MKYIIFICTLTAFITLSCIHHKRRHRHKRNIHNTEQVIEHPTPPKPPEPLLEPSPIEEERNPYKIYDDDPKLEKQLLEEEKPDEEEAKPPSSWYQWSSSRMQHEALRRDYNF